MEQTLHSTFSPKLAISSVYSLLAILLFFVLVMCPADHSSVTLAPPCLYFHFHMCVSSPWKIFCLSDSFSVPREWWSDLQEGIGYPLGKCTLPFLNEAPPHLASRSPQSTNRVWRQNSSWQIICKDLCWSLNLVYPQRHSLPEPGELAACLTLGCGTWLWFQTVLLASASLTSLFPWSTLCVFPFLS